jgi:hypothetical protein
MDTHRLVAAEADLLGGVARIVLYSRCWSRPHFHCSFAFTVYPKEKKYRLYLLLDGELV